MKNFKLLTAIFIVVSNWAYSQVNPIEIVKTKTDNLYSISIKNNTAQDLDLSLVVSGSGFEKIPASITKKVPKFQVVEFTKIKPIPNSMLSFSTSYKVNDDSTKGKITK